MSSISVLLADDSRIVRHQLKRSLALESGVEVVGEAKNGREAIALTEKLRPHVVLMDIGMPLLNGFEATFQILKTQPSTNILILSIHTDEAYVLRAVQSGAMGYLIKHTCAKKVGTAIRHIVSGKGYFSSSIPDRRDRIQAGYFESCQEQHALISTRTSHILQRVP